jgi:hypothetical protein
METRIEGGLADVFDFVGAEDVLPKVLTGYGMLPAVVRTSGNTGPWDKPGSNRLVHLKDGTTAREEVTAYRRPEYFAYKSSEFTCTMVGRLATWSIESGEATGAGFGGALEVVIEHTSPQAYLQALPAKPKR